MIDEDALFPDLQAVRFLTGILVRKIFVIQIMVHSNYLVLFRKNIQLIVRHEKMFFISVILIPN